MARTISFTKEQILMKTKEFISQKGIEQLNTRELSKFIGCSTQPLFRTFNSMDNFKIELKKYLHDYYNEFITKIVNKEDYLFTISYAYALFAYKESYIFKALFMSDLGGTRTIKEVLNSPQNIATIKSIPKRYGLTKTQAEKLYITVRFYTHGLSCQIACKSIKIDEKEIKVLIDNVIEKLKDVI